MAGIEALIKKWKRINLNKIIQSSLQANKKVLEELQIGQMQFGISPTGGKIGKYKSASYAKYKYQLSSLAGLGYIDLRLTGDFHKGIFVTITSSDVVFFSSDSKTADLEERYDPFGLAPKTWATFDNKFLGKEFQKQLNNELRKM